VTRLLAALRDHGSAWSSTGLIQQLGATDDERAQWLPVLWNLALTGKIKVNMDVPFGADIPVWLDD